MTPERGRQILGATLVLGSIATLNGQVGRHYVGNAVMTVLGMALIFWPSGKQK